MTFTDTLVEFAHAPLNAPLNAVGRARDITALSTLDWAACGIAGYAEGTFTRWADGQAAFGFSPTFAGEDLTTPAAALVNGTLSHALDFDDTHFAHIGHPSVVVFSAVLAAKPANWDDLQDAALVGIEASIRVGLYLGRDHYQRGFHQTATAGAFGACLGVARAMKLTPTQTRHALGLCATMASGLKAQFGTMGKPLNAGLAARAGYEATRWASSGMTGAEDGLEAFAHALGADQDTAGSAGLHARWHTETLSHKFHACCHGLHANLEALAGYSGPQPDHIKIETHPRWMSVCNIPTPATGLEVKFSYTHTAAMALSGIATGNIRNFSDAIAQNVDLFALSQKVSVQADDGLSEMQARVTVTSGDTSEVLFHDLAEPLAMDVLDQKLRTKTDALIGKTKAAALWQARDAKDLSAFRAAAFT